MPLGPNANLLDLGVLPLARARAKQAGLQGHHHVAGDSHCGAAAGHVHGGEQHDDADRPKQGHNATYEPSVISPRAVIDQQHE